MAQNLLFQETLAGSAALIPEATCQKESSKTADGNGKSRKDCGITIFEGGKINLGPDINVAIFGQILDMDDEDQERKFSKSIVHDFFKQTKICFADMKVALKQEDLRKLSWLSNFLRGSSVTIGLIKVTDCCVKIQHMGQQRNEDDSADEPDEKKCLAAVSVMLEKAELECTKSYVILKNFFGDDLEANE